jgi:SOS response regulatory protein OraA/RecX
MTTKRDWENILYTAELRGEKRGREEERQRIASELLSLGVPDRIIQEALEMSLEDL